MTGIVDTRHIPSLINCKCGAVLVLGKLPGCGETLFLKCPHSDDLLFDLAHEMPDLGRTIMHPTQQTCVGCRGKNMCAVVHTEEKCDWLRGSLSPYPLATS